MTGDPHLELERDNAGTLYYWDPEYESFHSRAWQECQRVTRKGGIMFLNISNFVKGGEEQHVVGLHIKLLVQNGWTFEERHEVGTPRLRYGQNREARVDTEIILIARRA